LEHTIISIQNYAKDNFIIDTFELRRAALFESLNYSMIDRQNRHVKLTALKTFHLFSSPRLLSSPEVTCFEENASNLTNYPRVLEKICKH